MSISSCLSTPAYPLLLLCCVIALGGINAQNRRAAERMKIARDAIKSVMGMFGRDDNLELFLCRIVAAESVFGALDFNGGGWWQVGLQDFLKTQDETRHGMKKKHDAIRTKMGIDWKRVKFNDLKTPLYSAIAATLYLHINQIPIPKGIRSQAKYWIGHYHKGKGSERLFIRMDRLFFELKGDPHILQVVHGSGKPICYDVYGNNGDVYKFLDDPSIGLRIVAKLFRRKRNQKVFVDALDVVSGANAIRVTRQYVYLGDEAFPWRSRQVGVGSGMDAIDVTISNKNVVVETVLAEIVIRKIFNHLDFDASPIFGLDRNATGILADVANNVQIVVRSPVNNDTANHGVDTGKLKKTRYLLVSNPEGGQSTLKVRSNKRCWKFDQDETFQRLITRNLL